jgi:hypothetical protein
MPIRRSGPPVAKLPKTLYLGAIPVRTAAKTPEKGTFWCIFVRILLYIGGSIPYYVVA